MAGATRRADSDTTDSRLLPAGTSRSGSSTATSRRLPGS